ncbi:MAG: N-6 DNA methylase [Planctomycetaceae bacterium]|jgi:type I restriction-modification system DNA methylase subunit|nr:N-6 DNA methylase [Planctomycetaceae bacterium]
MPFSELRQKWNENAEAYKTAEIGGGVQDFVNDILKHSGLFNLKLTPQKFNRKNTFVHDTESGKKGRPDFVLYISKVRPAAVIEMTVPVEVKCYGRIHEGILQLKRYQTDELYTKEYGILTDGYEWRFYRSRSHRTWTLDEMLARPKDFLTFWESYLEPENYYLEVFAPEGQGVLFDEQLDLNVAENRSVFFRDTTKIISRFRVKIKIEDNKTAIETAYAYLIQFIMYKVLVDNRFQRFENEYRRFRQQIIEAIRSRNLYNLIVYKVRDISEYISKNVYRQFAEEQRSINEKLVADLSRELEIDDIAPWLDIIAFINKYDFANIQNEIFGFVYENYLKDLYGENSGQFFTAPETVNFMLDELGYTEEYIKEHSDKISIIDPACGAGTFLYSAVHRIKNALNTKSSQEQAKQIKELIDKNIFGLDIAEFPLYLAELCILVDLLPLIINEKFVQPVESKLKLFKTRDSISEFLDTGITAQAGSVDLFSHVQDMNLGYNSFMRTDKDLVAMLESMQGSGDQRLRFDFVAMNPPYVGYLECLRQKIEFTQKIKDKENTSITLGNVFGVNLHSVPGHPKKYRPNPNLFAFFFALGIALLKDNGKLCMIIPQTLLTAGDLDVLRYHLANRMSLEKIFTFSGHLFIGRGLSQNKAVPTSSMIIIAQKKKPNKNHPVKIIRFQFETDKKGSSIGKLLRSKKRAVMSVPQTTLAEHWDNWNFLNHDAEFLRFYETYSQSSESIDVYYNHQLAKERFGSEFWFDGGYAIDEKQVQSEPADYIYPKINHRFYTVRTAESECKGYWKNIRTGHSPQRIGLTQGNQGYHLLGTKYKIVWTYANTKRFYFTDQPVIWARNQYNAVGSNNRKEILYLFALLNARINGSILLKQLKNPNEKDFLISRSSLKDYIRIPKITAKNQKLKDAVIAETETLLALENVILQDIVDFGKLSVQKFNGIRVVNRQLVLTNGREFRLPIKKGKEVLVKKVIDEKYLSGEMFSPPEIPLSELKSLPAIDFDQQTSVKKKIDDSVFALYFGIPVEKAAKHEFYGYVNS